MKRNPLCKFTIQEEQEMIHLYKNGLGLTQIGNSFKVRASRIRRILKAYNIKLRSHGEGTRLLHDHLEINPPKDFPWHLNNKFSKLLAIFLLTDGYMKSGGGIMLICTDKTLQNYFLTVLKEEYGLAPTVNSYMKKGKETIVHSKLVASNLLELSPTYKTCPRNCRKKEYLKKPQPSISFLDKEEKDVLIEAIRIAMSTDGTINVDFPHNSIYPKLEFSCAHPTLIRQWQIIFDKIGIRSYIIRSNITWSKLRGFGIKELKSIKRFIEIGGFIEGVQITGKSKYYVGITKNNLLNIVFKLNKHSFHFPENLSTPEKHKIIKDKILNPSNKNIIYKNNF